MSLHKQILVLILRYNNCFWMYIIIRNVSYSIFKYVPGKMDRMGRHGKHLIYVNWSEYCLTNMHGTLKNH